MTEIQLSHREQDVEPAQQILCSQLTAVGMSRTCHSKKPLQEILLFLKV